ncbi:MAG: biopolymer transporter ExbD [Nannocystis sp.]|nr:biopolymer transporter ExbD [Nannocystis sp.]
MSGLLEDGFHGDGPVAGINVTPLVDVMLCLLVIFMVSTPLMAPEAPMQISIPKAVGSPVAEEQFLLSTISIDAKGGVFLGTVGLSSDPNTLGAELGSNAKLKEAGMVFIQGDEIWPSTAWSTCWSRCARPGCPRSAFSPTRAARRRRPERVSRSWVARVRGPGRITSHVRPDQGSHHARAALALRLDRARVRRSVPQPDRVRRRGGGLGLVHRRGRGLRAVRTEAGGQRGGAGGRGAPDGVHARRADAQGREARPGGHPREDHHRGDGRGGGQDGGQGHHRREGRAEPGAEEERQAQGEHQGDGEAGPEQEERQGV